MQSKIFQRLRKVIYIVIGVFACGILVYSIVRWIREEYANDGRAVQEQSESDSETVSEQFENNNEVKREEMYADEKIRARQQLLREYYAVTNPNSAYYFEYVGQETEIDEIRAWPSYCKAYHFRVLEVQGNMTLFQADAYLYGGINEEDFFTKDARGIWRKHSIQTVQANGKGNREEDGKGTDECKYAFCMAYGEDGSMYSDENMKLEVTVLKVEPTPRSLPSATAPVVSDKIKEKVSYETVFIPVEYDGVYVDLSEWATTDCDIWIADLNFDGYLDLGVEVGARANWGGAPTLVYVWEGEEKTGGTCSYRKAGLFMGMPSLNPDQELLYEFNRGGYGMYYYVAYQYRDGEFVKVATLDEIYVQDGETEERCAEYKIVDEAGNVEEYTGELPDKWKEFWGWEK